MTFYFLGSWYHGSMKAKVMREVIFRLLASLFLVAIVAASYLAIKAAYIQPAQDIYLQDCTKQSLTCGSFQLAAAASATFMVILGMAIILGLCYTLWPLTQLTKRGQREAALEPEEEI